MSPFKITDFSFASTKTSDDDDITAAQENFWMSSGTSSLIFGVQWDLVLKYLETKNAATQSELKTDSTSIGNYKNNLWNITNTSAKYSSGNWRSCPYEKQQKEMYY